MGNPAFRAVIFRRTYPMIENEGGLWEESGKLYPQLGAKPKQTDLKWVFPSKMTVRFAHMQHEDDKLNWQGAQIPFIGFDELTHFTESQFFYLLSRNRSLSGVTPYVRATCNPDALSWVKKFLAPWIDKACDPALKADSGDIRWMVRDGNDLYWFLTRADALAAAEDIIARLPVGIEPTNLVKSVTFVAATVYDNKILLAQNPEYLGNLLALPLVERKRLLEGDWDVLPEAGKVFDRAWFEVVEAGPAGRREALAPGATDGRDRQHEVRFWDLAASVKKARGDDPDWTVGVKLARYQNRYYVLDVQRFRATPGDLEERIANIASQDGKSVVVRWEEEGGSSGKIAARRLSEVLAAYDARSVRPTGDKLARAMPVAAQAEAGNVKAVRAPWNDGFLSELHHFPDAPHDDQVDALSGAYNYLAAFGADVAVGPDIWSE